MDVVSWEKMGLQKVLNLSSVSLKPLFRILRFAALLIIFIVSIKIIGKLG